MIDTIPQEVLLDYQSRTISDARNPVYSNAEHTMLDAEVLFEELLSMGYVPFTAHEVAETKHEEQLWLWAHEGKYGPIGEYVPLPPPDATAQWAAPLTTQAVIDLEVRVTALEDAMAAMKKDVK